MKLSWVDAQKLDAEFSNREIELDAKGYFLIYLDRSIGLICADLYSNTINNAGIACDPETGTPLPCTGTLERKPIAMFRGRTAKELCIAMFETPHEKILDRVDHAAYVGREAMRAEIALYGTEDYIQD
jgi:dihydropteroate synthase